jgi:Domain of unknown function (DUF4259)
MGAWGEDPFDNDDAGDWAYGFDSLDGGGGVAYIRAALAIAAGTASGEDLEAPDGSIAIAAADVVARLAEGAPMPSTYGSDVAGWVVRTSPAVSDTDVALARDAVARVLAEGSELAELWDEAGPEWRAATEDLLTRLG